MPVTKKKGPTKAELQRKILELEAQLASTYHFASLSLPKTGEAHMASGIMVQLTKLGGAELCPPFVVVNGLSMETIDALQADIRRSWVWKTEMKPKGIA